MSRTVRDVVDALRPDHEAEVEPTRFLLETARRAKLRRARRRLVAASAGALVAVFVLVGLSAAFATGSHGREAPAVTTTSALTTPTPTPSLPGTLGLRRSLGHRRGSADFQPPIGAAVNVSVTLTPIVAPR